MESFEYDYESTGELSIEIPTIKTAGKIKIWICNTNSNYRGYGIRVPITGHFIWDKGTGTSTICNQADGHPTLELLKEVAGIDHIMMSSAYEIRITKAMAFEWDEIEPSIISILTNHNAIERL